MFFENKTRLFLRLVRNCGALVGTGHAKNVFSGVTRGEHSAYTINGTIGESTRLGIVGPWDLSRSNPDPEERIRERDGGICAPWSASLGWVLEWEQRNHGQEKGPEVEYNEINEVETGVQVCM